MSLNDITCRFGSAHTSGGGVLDDVDIHFQPINDVSDIPTVIGFEALGRKNGVTGLQSIGPFIDEIHAMGLRPELELRTLEKACCFLRSCDRVLQPDQAESVYVTVNLHPETLMQQGLLDEIETAIDEYPGARSRIRFEILEHEFPEEAEEDIVENIRGLSEAGYLLYLDDFGDTPGQDEHRMDMLLPYVYGVKLSGSLWEREPDERESFLSSLYDAGGHDKVIVVEGVENDDHLAETRTMSEKYGFEKVYAQGWHPLLGASMTPQSAMSVLGLTELRILEKMPG